MERANSKYYEAMITLTAYPEWKEWCDEIAKEIYQIQANALESKDYGDLCERKGFAKGLAYVINLRDDTLKARQIEESNDADV